MTTPANTVLDHIDNIIVPGNVFAEPRNEFWLLVCLSTGMDYLYRQASRIDEIARERVNPHGRLHFVCLGNMPELASLPGPLLTCAFHWYAMSAYQYALTVGAIAYRQDNSRPKPTQYVQKVMPEILAFRDKVAAHVAWAKNNSRDNEAERFASVLPAVTFVDDSFYVGAFTVTLSQEGKASSSQVLQPWSICKTHEVLKRRYWPDSQSQPARNTEQISGEGAPT